jgi:hypothetical protein
LSNPDSRERFGFQTRFRVVARNIGDYTGEPVVETEEMVVETPTFSFQDYLDARVFHLLLTIYYYEGNYAEVFELARQRGVRPFDVILRLQHRLDRAPAAFQQLIADFVRESQEELFDTAEECVAWARQHFQALVEGTLGGNLLSKYSMLGRFYTTGEATDFLGAGVADLLGCRLEEDEVLATVIAYLHAVLLHVPFAESVAATRSWTTRLDVESWRADGYARPLETYRLPVERTYQVAASPGRRQLILSRIATFGEHPAGLGKFTRTLFARELRREPQAEAGRAATIPLVSLDELPTALSR